MKSKRILLTDSLLALMVSMMMFVLMGTAHAAPFVVGDVFAATGAGQVNVYSQTGVFKQTLNTGLGGFTTGMAFDAAGNFYVTAFSANQVSKFDTNGVLVDATFAAGISLPESLVFNAAGDLYIGNAGAAQIQKVDSSGTPIINYATLQNTDWIDLAADQVTMLYSNEGSTMRVLNLNTLVDTVFATKAGEVFFAKRFLADGGVLVASNSGNAFRFDAAGVLQQTYASGIGGVFALNLDPNGTSFWTGATGGQDVRKFNIATGAVEQSWSTGTGQLFGLAVFGEITQGGGGTTVPEPGTLTLLGIGLLALGASRRNRKKRAAT